MNKKIARVANAGNRWLDPILEDFFSVPSLFDRRAENFVPRTNITDSEEKLAFSFEVPGMEKDDIKVTIADRVLCVTGRRESSIDSENKHVIRQEILTGTFERQFTLPESVKSDSIQAQYKNGILTIELDKKEEVKPREVDVKIK